MRAVLQYRINLLTRCKIVFRQCYALKYLHTNIERRSAAFVELTQKRYPNLKRGAFANLTDADVTTLERIVSGKIITDSFELEDFNTDWLRTLRGI